MGDPGKRVAHLNLLFLSIDSLRLDFVSRANAQIRTPRFDALARDFYFCDRCFSVSSATRPVHATLFTGLYPFEHGVLGQRHSRMRIVPHLFELFEKQGYRVAAFSEVPAIFTGLEFAPWIEPLAPLQMARFLQGSGPCFLFLHCWGAHPPYGAADGLAMGETARLLRAGQRAEVIARYQQAVERVFEQQLAPLLAQLDLRQWGVLLLGDHGQSWSPEELYHGQTLRNAVLRVPLYLHIPHPGNPPLPGPLVSLVDVFPTLVALFGLPVEYRGFGRDLRAEIRLEYYLAQIHPVPQEAEEQLIGIKKPGRQWALFDAEKKFTWDEDRGEGRLERTFTEERLPDQGDYFKGVYARLQAESAYAHLPPAESETDEVLDRRLRELGYL